jgi:subtilase family serine protease
MAMRFSFRTGKSSNPRQGQPRSHLRSQLRLEPLEARNLLAVYPLTPMETRHAYGFDALPLGSNDGTGQTIAIVDAFDDPNIFGDLDTFDQTYGVTSGQTLYAQYGPASSVLTKYKVGGKRTRADPGWAQEISLDVEWAHAIAPGAHILLVEARTNSDSDLLAAVDYATSHGAAVVSMSWGGGEFAGETSDDSHFNHAGVTCVASAGDTGSVVEWPAVSASVVGVGGTSLNVDASGNYLGEAGWGGSGGGISSQVNKPSYQANVPQSSTNRTSPDVGYNADPNTGFAVYDSYIGGFGWGQYGGTSAGAPQWAALIAIADQGRSAKLSSSGTLNALYGLLSSTNTVDTTKLHDVTSGSSGHFSAAPGYDLVTGLGTPKADQLIPYLRGVAASVQTSATVSTTSTLPSSGASAHPTLIVQERNYSASTTAAFSVPLEEIAAQASSPPLSSGSLERSADFSTPGTTPVNDSHVDQFLADKAELGVLTRWDWHSFQSQHLLAETLTASDPLFPTDPLAG